MPPIERPPVELVDVEKVLLSISPKDADNRDVELPAASWSSSDTSVISLEPAQDDAGADQPNARWARSGAPGSATVTVVSTLASGESLTESILLTVKVGEPSALNLSAGAPVPE